MSSRRPPLSHDRIIDAALHLVDAQGLRRLTMRRLGDALEVEAMAIYHHLPRGKEQLLDALIGHVADVPAPPPSRQSGKAATGRGARAGARGRLNAWARDYRSRLIAHSGVMPLLLTRRNSSALARTSGSVREVLTAAGLPDETARTGSHTLVSYVIGHCAVEVRDSRLDAAADGTDGTDWDTRFQAGLDLVLTAVTMGTPE